MPIQAVLFDHDGTLVDSEPIHLELWNTVLEKYGIQLSLQHYQESYAGVSTSANACNLVARYDIAINPAQLAQEKEAQTASYLQRQAFPLMPGASETLESLHGLGLKLGVVTGAARPGIQATIRANQFEPLFSVIVSGDDVRRGKPAPECYLLALKLLCLEAADCIAIEDTEAGLRAASAAGMRCIAVPNGMSRLHDFSLAVASVVNMSEACDYIQNLYLSSRR